MLWCVVTIGLAMYFMSIVGQHHSPSAPAVHPLVAAAVGAWMGIPFALPGFAAFVAGAWLHRRTKGK